MLKSFTGLVLVLLLSLTAVAQDEADNQGHDPNPGPKGKPDVIMNEVSFQGEDAYIRLLNRTEEERDLGGFTFVQKDKDGNVISEWAFPEGTKISPHGDLTIARSGEAYSAANQGGIAEYEFYDDNAGETPDTDHAEAINLIRKKDSPGNDEIKLDSKYGGVEMRNSDGEAQGDITFWGSDPYLDQDFIKMLQDGGVPKNMPTLQPDELPSEEKRNLQQMLSAGGQPTKGGVDLDGMKPGKDRPADKPAETDGDEAPATVEEAASWPIWVLGGAFLLVLLFIFRPGRPD